MNIIYRHPWLSSSAYAAIITVNMQWLRPASLSTHNGSGHLCQHNMTVVVSTRCSLHHQLGLDQVLRAGFRAIGQPRSSQSDFYCSSTQAWPGSPIRLPSHRTTEVYPVRLLLQLSSGLTRFFEPAFEPSNNQGLPSPTAGSYHNSTQA
jgi:hypothetical protein